MLSLSIGCCCNRSIDRLILILQINLTDIGEIYKVRLELSPLKQTQEPEWKIKTVIFFFVHKKTVVFVMSTPLLSNDDRM